MKPSWTEVTAFGLLLLFALVMAHGWPSGDWSLGWGAIGALGTVVLGTYAARISHAQHSSMEKEQAYRRQRITQKIVGLARELHNSSFAAIGMFNIYGVVPEELSTQIDTLLYEMHQTSSELDLSLLDDRRLKKFQLYCKILEAESEMIGMHILANKSHGQLGQIRAIERIKKESFALVFAFTDSTYGLYVFDDA